MRAAASARLRRMSSPNDEGIRRSAAAGGAASGAGPSSAVASSSGSATATGSSGTASNTVASPTSFEEGGRARRGLDRLSGGLRELGLDVLSRRQRHERDKSNASSKSGGTVPATSAGATAGPVSRLDPIASTWENIADAASSVCRRAQICTRHLRRTRAVPPLKGIPSRQSRQRPRQTSISLPSAQPRQRQV